MSSTKIVITIANTPSVSASIRALLTPSPTSGDNVYPVVNLFYNHYCSIVGESEFFDDKGKRGMELLFIISIANFTVTTPRLVII